MRILTFSTLYPNAAMRQHGIFVAERLKHLVATRKVDATVVAPVPWFPVTSPLFPVYSKFARVPKAEIFDGITVFHPRYPVVPKIGMSIAPYLLALASLGTTRRELARAPFDLIDAHYFYPDGVAAVLLGRWLGKPVVITGRGTDLNLIPRYRVPRHLIRWACSEAAALATVSESLRKTLICLGVPTAKTRTLRNGVDLDVFRPVVDRDALRSRLGVTGISLLSVGHLIERKGHHIAVRALAELPRNFELRIAGDGPMQASLARLAQQVGVDDRVHFLGRLDRLMLVEAYNAADLLVLASSREGMANVLLESMSCGTPVVATNVWGAPEVVEDCAGELIVAREPTELAEGIRRLVARSVARGAVRRHAERFSWESTTQGQLDMFRCALKAYTQRFECAEKAG